MTATAMTALNPPDAPARTHSASPRLDPAGT